MKRTLALLAAALLTAAGCATGVTARTESARPRLVVFMAVDGLPQRQVVDYRAQLAPDGLRRFLDRGAWFANAHYGYANTQTAPGHATMLTGAYPHRTGIIANEWRNPETNQLVYNTGDTGAQYLGHSTKALDGTSPRNLLAETVGDVLKRTDPASKVIAISGKDRGAILPAGKTGTAYMYQAQTGQFASSSAYMREHPAWVTEFHAAKPADRYFQQEWTPLLGEASAYAPSLADEQKWYAKGGKLPKRLGEGHDKAGPLYYGSLLATPYGDRLTLDFARAAIRGEKLGVDDAPDILSVSLSGHDYVNHAYGAESRISHDHVLHLDRLFAEFFRDLDATVGAGNYVAVLTSDHGFMPVPDHSLTLGRDAGRVSGTQLVAKVNAGLAPKFGEAQWVLSLSAQGLLLNRKLIAEKKADADAIADEAARIAAQEPGVAATFTRKRLMGQGGDALLQQVRRSWHPERSADVQLVLKPYWMYGSSSNVTTHGSPHPYDTHVPILMYGPPWVKPGRVDTRVEVADIAPTLSGILGIPAPALAEGKPLPLPR